MADVEFYEIMPAAEAGFTQEDATTIQTVVAFLFGHLEVMPARLMASIVVSLLVTFMLNRTTDPDVAWSRINKLVRENMQKARIQAGAAGSA